MEEYGGQAINQHPSGSRNERAPDYQRLLDARIPTAYRGSNAGSTNDTAVVEVSDDVLSPSATPASVTSQPSSAFRNRPSGNRRSGRQNNNANQRNRPRVEEEYQHHQRNAQRFNGHPPPPAAPAFIGNPYQHIYHFYANNGELITDFRVGSSIEHSAIDVVHDANGYSIRVWYRIPTE